MSDNHYNSINKETGMLDDIGEVRELALTLSSIAMRLLLHPAMSFVYTPEVIADLAAFLVMADALVEPTTQYQLFQRLGRLFGMTQREIEVLAEELHFSHEYPTTHPQAQKAWSHLPTAHPLHRAEPSEQPVSLPSHIEAFLQKATKRGGTQNGNNPGEHA